MERPSAQDVAARAVEIAIATKQKLDEAAAAENLILSEDAVIIGAIISDRLADLDESLVPIANNVGRE